jgi:enamine deaminase RidA (YjgF/YER057c/UK114 family)
MLPRRAAWPDGHWGWAIPVSHKHGIRCGPMIFVGGQVDLDAEGRVRHPGDRTAQCEQVVTYIERVLRDLGADLADLVKLTVYYVSDGTVAEQELLARIGRRLQAPGPVVTAVPVSWLAYPGLEMEVEALAMLSPDGARLERTVAAIAHPSPLPPPFVEGLRCGDMVLTSAQADWGDDGSVRHPGDLLAQSEAAMGRLGDVLAALGADFGDAVKINNFYIGGGTKADWEGAARVRARSFCEPGPAATGIALPRLYPKALATKIEVIAMRGADGRRLERRHAWPKGHWDWPIHLPYKHGVKCADMIFLGGQVSLAGFGEVVDPGDMAAQTRTSMANIRRILEDLGACMDDVVKITAFYQGHASAEEHAVNFRISADSFSEPGPATTGIPLPYLSYRDMVIEIEAIAMAR